MFQPKRKLSLTTSIATSPIGIPLKQRQRIAKRTLIGVRDIFPTATADWVQIPPSLYDPPGTDPTLLRINKPVGAEIRHKPGRAPIEMDATYDFSIAIGPRAQRCRFRAKVVGWELSSDGLTTKLHDIRNFRLVAL